MKHTVEVTLILAAMFFCAQVVGLYVVDQYRQVEVTETGEVNVTWQALPAIGGVELERPEIEPTKSIWLIVVAIIAGTVLLMLLVRMRHDVLWRLWFFLAVLVCLTISFNAFVGSMAAFVGALVFAYAKIFRQSFIVQNLTELFVYGGLAAIFVPLLDKFSALVLLALISLYDMYAVWKSKHMIKLAKFQTEARIFAGMLVPYGKPKIQKRKKGKKGKKREKQRIVKIKTAILGGGDIGFPLIFAGVIMGGVGFWKALIIPVFVSAALLMLLLWGKKDRFYPAMPFLSIGCLAGYGVLSIIETVILLL